MKKLFILLLLLGLSVPSSAGTHSIGVAAGDSLSFGGAVSIATGLNCSANANSGKVTVGSDGIMVCADDVSTAGDPQTGAPTDATYITKTANGDLSAEFALSSLLAGILETDGDGNISVATAGTDYLTSLAAGNISDISANGASLITAANYAAMKGLLDLEIGTDVQAYDADLTTYAGITPGANVQSLLGAANYAAMRGLLDLEAGTDFYAKSAIDTDFAFSTFPTTPEAAPDANYEVANKKYVDDNTDTIAWRSKIAFENPVATDDFFFDEVAFGTVTFTSIYCKTLVGTVDLDVTIAGTDINGTDITCTTVGVLDDLLGGDTAGAVGEELKLAITSVASAPTYLMVIVNGTQASQ